MINETSLESTHGINQQFHVLEASNVAQCLLDCLLACQPSIFAAEDLRKTVMQEASCVLRWWTASLGSHDTTTCDYMDYMVLETWNLISFERQSVHRNSLFFAPFFLSNLARLSEEQRSCCCFGRGQRWHWKVRDACLLMANQAK